MTEQIICKNQMLTQNFGSDIPSSSAVCLYSKAGLQILIKFKIAVCATCLSREHRKQNNDNELKYSIIWNKPRIKLTVNCVKLFFCFLFIIRFW